MSSRTKPKKSAAAPLAKKPFPKRVSGVAPKPAKGRAKLTEVAVPKAAKRPSEVTKPAKPKSKRSSAGTLAAASRAEDTTSKHPKLRAKDAAVAKKPAKASKATKQEPKEAARAKSTMAKPAKKVDPKPTAASASTKRAASEERPKPRKGRPVATAPGSDGELDSASEASDSLAPDAELQADANDRALRDGAYERAVDAPTLLSDISEIRGARAEDIAADLGLDASAMSEELEQEEASAVAPPASRSHLKSVIESLVFVADQAITPLSLGRIVKAKQADVRALLDEIRADYDGRGIELIEVGGGFQFRSAAASAPFVRDLVAHRPVRLTRAQLETLALIAYRQPITRPEIDDVRGVDSGSAIKVLLDRDLVKILGRKDEAGRPLLYGTGPQFLEFFGMKSLQDLPTLREFTELNEENRELFQRKMGEIPDLSDPAFNPSAAHSDDTEAEGRDEWREDSTEPVEPLRDGEPEGLDRAPSEGDSEGEGASDVDVDRGDLEGEALETERDEADHDVDEYDAPESDAALDDDVQGEASDDELDAEDDGEHEDELADSDEREDDEDADEDDEAEGDEDEGDDEDEDEGDEDDDSERDFEADDDPHASHEDESDVDESDADDESDDDADDEEDDDDNDDGDADDDGDEIEDDESDEDEDDEEEDDED